MAGESHPLPACARLVHKRSTTSQDSPELRNARPIWEPVPALAMWRQKREAGWVLPAPPPEWETPPQPSQERKLWLTHKLCLSMMLAWAVEPWACVLDTTSRGA